MSISLTNEVISPLFHFLPHFILSLFWTDSIPVGQLSIKIWPSERRRRLEDIALGFSGRSVRVCSGEMRSWPESYQIEKKGKKMGCEHSIFVRKGSNRVIDFTSRTIYMRTYIHTYARIHALSVTVITKLNSWMRLFAFHFRKNVGKGMNPSTLPLRYW